MNDLLTFLQENSSALQQKTIEHILLVGFSLFLASALAIPLGILLVRFSFLRHTILRAGSISQTIPSLAMLGFLVPLLGLGNVPALVVLTFYAIYPILRSTYTGLISVPPECIEAAEGLGFSNLQKLGWVELPLALPIMISGLRIATASTIGIATIAAFIGAGGLGDFITQGLALNNSALILLGAIPIAFLALAFDYGISQLENQFHHRKKKGSRSPRLKTILLGISSLGIVFLGGNYLYQEHITAKGTSITIASKNFTEQYILAELMAQLIEMKTPLKVVRKLNLGTTDIIHQALLKGDVDLYPEYSGTAYLTILKEPPSQSGEDIFPKVRGAYKDKFNLVWLKPFGFSNSQSLAVKKDFAQAHNLQNLSDLALIAPDLTIAAPPEFLKRPDGMLGLSQSYGLEFKNVMQVDPNLMYMAIDHQEVEVIAAFTTDGKLQKYQLIPLNDDKKFYPPYHCAPVIRATILTAYPEIYEALSVLFGHIDEEKMRRLNAKVDLEGRTPFDVAQEFLVELN
ncbi:MAG: ABC transporter permease subunit [Alphaproteobacteria bacterium]|nr:ABC transporter permease subunit [Alphaproteobacteria bacterium]